MGMSAAFEPEKAPGVTIGIKYQPVVPNRTPFAEALAKDLVAPQINKHVMISLIIFMFYHF